MAVGALVGEVDDDREALGVAQPAALALDGDELTRGAAGRLIHREAFAGHRALEDPSGQLVQGDVHRRTGLDPVHAVLAHVGLDPDVARGDEGHQRRPLVGIVALVQLEVGDAAVGWCVDSRLRQIDARLLERGRRVPQPGVLLAARTQLLLRALQIRLGGREIGLRLGQSSLRPLPGVRRYGARVLLVDPLVAFLVELRLFELRPRLSESRLGCLHRCRVRAGRLAGNVEGRLGPQQGQLVLPRLDLDQQIARLDHLILDHVHLFHAAGHNASDTVKLSQVFTYHAGDNHPIQQSRLVGLRER